ncbi:hypothetical protein DUD43_06475 [Alcaligenes faecalis]|nr:hypothetical protein DUD43_06475 [Alcaligenes faecalis]
MGVKFSITQDQEGAWAWRESYTVRYRRAGVQVAEEGRLKESAQTFATEQEAITDALKQLGQDAERD